MNLSIVPYDSFYNATAFVFGFAQGSSIPIGRIAQRYLDYSSDENVIYTIMYYVVCLLPVIH